MFSLAAVSVNQAARLSSSASGTKFLQGLTRRSDHGSRRLFGCTLPGAALQLSARDVDQSPDAMVHHHVVVLDTTDGWVMCSCFRPLRCGTWCKHLWAVWMQGHLWFTPLLLHPAWLLPDTKKVSRNVAANQRCYSAIRRSALAPAQLAMALVLVTPRASWDSIVALYRDKDPSWCAEFWATATAYCADDDTARSALEDGVDEGDAHDSSDDDDDDAGGKGRSGKGQGGTRGRGAGAREADKDDDDGSDGDGQARRGAAAKTSRWGAPAKRLKPAGSHDDLTQRTYRIRDLAAADPNVRKRLLEAMEDIESFAQRSTDDRFEKRLASAALSRAQKPASSSSTPAQTRQSPPVRTSKSRKKGAADIAKRKPSRPGVRRDYTEFGIDARDDETQTVAVRASGRSRKRKRDEEE